MCHLSHRDYQSEGCLVEFVFVYIYILNTMKMKKEDGRITGFVHAQHNTEPESQHNHAIHGPSKVA